MIDPKLKLQWLEDSRLVCIRCIETKYMTSMYGNYIHTGWAAYAFAG